MAVDKHHNLDYASGIPIAVGDRHHAQDKFRDIQFLRDRIGALSRDAIGEVPVFVSGGIVTQGNGDNLDITPAVGYVGGHTVTLPDSLATLPGTTTTEDIKVRVSSPQQTNLAIGSATLDGSTVNYVKLAYAEVNGNTRDRAKLAGSYAYERLASFTITVDAIAPVAGEILLSTFVGSTGQPFIFSGARSRPGLPVPREYQAGPINIAAGRAAWLTPGGLLSAKGGTGNPFISASTLEITTNGGTFSENIVLVSCTEAGLGGRVLAVYADQVNNDVHARVLHFDPAGGAPTQGAEQDILLAGDVSNSDAVQVVRLEDDKFAFSYENGANLYEVVVGTLAGDVLTTGTAVSLFAGVAIADVILVTLSATAIMFTFTNSATNAFFGQVFTIAALVLTAGTSVQPGTEVSLGNNQLAALTSGLIIASYNQSPTFTHELRAATISGTVITWGAQQTVVTGSGVTSGRMLARWDGTTFIGMVSATGTVSSAYAGTISGTTITLGALNDLHDVAPIQSRGSSQVRSFRLPDGDWIVPLQTGFTRHHIQRMRVTNTDEARIMESYDYHNEIPFTGNFPITLAQLGNTGFFMGAQVTTTGPETRIFWGVFNSKLVGIAEAAIGDYEIGAVHNEVSVGHLASGFAPGFVYADENGALIQNDDTADHTELIGEIEPGKLGTILIAKPQPIAAYDTGWIGRDDWTNVHIGSGVATNVNSVLLHNLGARIQDLDVEVYLQRTALNEVDDDFHVMLSANLGDNVANLGLQIHGADPPKTGFILQTGSAGMQVIVAAGTISTVATAAGWYRVVVTRKQTQGARTPTTDGLTSGIRTH